MNIVVLSGSPRKGGNTDLLVEAFVKGASEKHNVEVVLVRDHHINPCIGCDSCFKRENNSCFQNDNMQLIYDKLLHADMLVVFADTPQGLAGRQAAHRDTHRREHTARRSRRGMPPPQAWGRGTAILRQL